MAWSKRKEDTPALARAAARRWKWQWVALDMYLYKGGGPGLVCVEVWPRVLCFSDRKGLADGSL